MSYNLNQFSVSRLSTFISCPFAFYLHYILKREAEFVSIFIGRGSALHEVLEKVNQDMQQGILLSADSYMPLIKAKIKEHDVSPGAILQFPIYVADYTKKVFPKITDARIIGVESKFDIPFTVEGKTYKFIGYLDLAVLRNSKVSIYDFKTKIKETPDLDIMLTRDLQIQSYSWIVHKFGRIQRGPIPKLCFDGAGIPVEEYGHIQYADKGQTSTMINNRIFNFDEIQERLTYWILQIENCIKKGYFPRNPSYCTYCDKKGFCLGHRKEGV